MSRVVWKFPFARAESELRLPVPAGSTPRFFAFQGQAPTVWIEVDPREETFEAWTFVLAGTGQPIPTGIGWSYVGSTMVGDEGAFVFHLYARLTTEV